MDKLNRVNKELSRKIKAIQNQGRALVEEKVELIFQLQQREQHLLELEAKLGETEKARKDLEQSKVARERWCLIRGCRLCLRFAQTASEKTRPIGSKHDPVRFSSQMQMSHWPLRPR